MKLLYIDTNIYLDYLLKRANLENKDISEPSFQVFKRAVLCEFSIAVSDKVLTELRAHVKPDEASLLFQILGSKVVKVRTEKEDVVKSGELPTEKADALHIILAKKIGADCIVTRNKKDFEGLFNAELPEDI